MATKRLNALITIGGSVTGALKSAFTSTEKHLTDLGRGVTRLGKEQRLLGNSITTFGKLGKNVDGLRDRYASVTKELERMQRAQDRALGLANAQAANLAKRSQLRGQIFDTVALGASMAAPIVAAAKFETAMLGVAKQLDGAYDQSGNLTQTYHSMAGQIKALASELPIATNEIAAMVAAGLRMGVAKEDIVEFTRQSAIMATAFDAPAGQLAESMGKIANLYKLPIASINQLGDTINWLDDKSGGTGAGIIDFLTRVGGVASSVRITGQEMAALGSTLETLGERTETAGTATNAMFQKFAAAEKGTKAFRAAMDEIGLSTSAVQKGMQTDAMGTLLQILEAVNKLPAESRIGVMTDLVGLEHSDTLGKLANRMGLLREQLALANSEAAKGSMGEEFAKRMKTVEAQTQLLSNNVRTLGINFGSVLLPAVNDVMGALGPAVTKIASLAETYPMATKAITGTITALVGMKVATLAGAYAFTFIKGGALSALGLLTRLPGLATAAAGGLTFLGSAVAMLGKGIVATGRLFLLNPIGLAVTAIAGSAYLIYKHWEPISDFFKRLWAGISDIFLTSINKIKGAITSVANLWDSTKKGVSATVSGAWERTKSAFGLGGPDRAPAAPQGAPTVGVDMAPVLPGIAPARAGATYTDNRVDNSRISMQITQQPGESQDGLVKRIMRELEQQSQLRQRSSMVDATAGAY